MSKKQNGLIIYDGSCPMCQGGAARFGSLLNHYHFGLIAIQDPWVQENIDCSEAEMMAEMKLWTKEKTLLGGLDAYRYIAKHIWWAVPLYLISGIPGIYQLSWWVYRRIAENRQAISQTCQLTPNDKADKS